MTRLLLLIGLAVFVQCSVLAQQRSVSGLVQGDEREPLAEVTVSVKGTKKAVLTGKDGRYRIDGVAGNAILVFTHVGFSTKEIPVSGKSVIDVVLDADASTMADVVIVGYGTQKKKDVTVSIEKVNMNDLNKAPVRSFDEALGGRVSGVQVTSSDGQPGALSRIVIRGNNSITQDNSPLYIIDGFPLENPNNNILNPSDIESIEVLKDASATAIYGSRGANGVIMITTKKGKVSPPLLSFSSSYGIQDVIKTMDLMSPYEFVRQQLERDTSSAQGSPRDIYLTIPGKTLDYYQTMPLLDWQSLALKRAAMQNHSLSVTGGNSNTKYALSGSVVNQDGVIINSNYTRYQGRVALDHTITRKFKMGINANYSFLRQEGVILAQSANQGTASVMYGLWGQRPLQSSTDVDLVDELFDPAINTSNDYRINPIQNLNNAVRNTIQNTLIANAYAEYAFLPELKLKVTGGINSNMRRNESFNNSKTQYGNPVTTSNGVNGSVLFAGNTSWLNENILSWNKRINKKHLLNLVGVFSMQKGYSDAYGTSANFLPNEEAGLSGLDEGIPVAITASSSNWSLLSLAGRGSYNFESKYYITASFRADGSSRFAPGNRWGYFPAASFAWRFSNERFMENIRFVSDAKLRIGYGRNGNNRVNDFAYMSTIGLPIGNAYTINNAPVRGSIPLALGNPALKWETTSETNIGLDLSMFNERVMLTAEAYDKKTNDLLLLATLPMATGYSTAFKNVGSVQNKGLEFTLSTVNVKNRNFSWNSSFNISFNRNSVLGLSEGQESLISAIPWDNGWQSVPAYMAKLNRPLGLIFGYIWDGVYQYEDFYKNSAGGYVLRDDVPTNGNTRANIQPGDIKYRDINGDGVVNAFDYTVIGNGIPKHNGGFSNNFTYGNFDLNIFFQWSYGNDILNANRIVFDGNGLNKANLNQYASYIDRWSPENQSSVNFRTRGFFGGGYSSRYVEDGSYLRLKTVALGYNLPMKLLNRIKVKSCRFHLSAQNLITWTNYSGMDPEVNAYNSALTPGFDYSPYPRARTITLGANLNF